MTQQRDRHAEARAILKTNDRGTYTIPTAGLYPYQWNWDSAIAAIGFATFDIDRAWLELETLMTGQWSDGMVPHILFHRADPGYFPGPEIWAGVGPIASSGVTQPPIATSMARLIWERDRAAGVDRLRSLWPRLRAWHGWFLRWRLDQGAVWVSHPWESGRDNAPDWDGAMAGIDPVDVSPYTRRDTSHIDGSMRPTKYDYDRYIWLVQHGRRLAWDPSALQQHSPFRVADPAMTFLLLRAHRDLLLMGQALGLATTGMAQEIALLEQGAASLWNEDLGSYDARDTRTGEWSGTISNASMLCWFAGIDNPRQSDQLARVLAAQPFGVASYDPAGDKFDGKRYWRGPVWAFMNFLICLGLEEHQHPLASQVRAKTHDLIAHHGFAEYFDPRDGTAAGGQAFTWTAAVWLAWAHERTGAAA